MSRLRYDGGDDVLSDIELTDHYPDDSKYIPKKSKWTKKKICLISCLGCGVLCIILLVILAIAVAIYFGRKNVNIYPNPIYTPSDDFVRFLLVGDMGRADEGQKKVAASMGKYCQSQKCDFIVGIGDNIYNYGVSDVNDEQFKTKFEDIYNVDGIDQLKWYMLLGNHDYRGNVQAQIDYTKISSRWVLPSHFYTLVKNSSMNGFDVSMVMLDTSPFVSIWTDPLMDRSYLETQYPRKEEQLQMLDRVLSTNQGKNNSWSLVFGHHHIYSGGIGGNSKDMMNTFLPYMEKYKVPLYSCGHVHLLNWLKNPEQPTNYIISGAGSSNIIPDVYNPLSLNVFTAPGFFSIEIQKDFMYVVAMDENGKEIFKFRIDK